MVCKPQCGVSAKMPKSFLLRMLVMISGLTFVMSILSACISINKEYGYFPSQESIITLEVGSFNKGKVKELIGPAAISKARNWIYIGSNISTTAFLSPKVVRRDILLLQFNEKNILASKDVFTIADGKIFDISTSKEIEDPRKVSVLRQLFGNLTNFSAENFIAQN